MRSKTWHHCAQFPGEITLPLPVPWHCELWPVYCRAQHWAMTLRTTELSPPQKPPICAEWERLFSEFISAIGDVLDVQAGNMGGVHLLWLVEARKRSAKNALLVHLAKHRNCGHFSGQAIRVIGP
jgi:hypothetical protein